MHKKRGLSLAGGLFFCVSYYRFTYPLSTEH